MNINTLTSKLGTASLVTCSPKLRGSRISLKFATEPPSEPGVYVVYQKNPEKPFYVGEARDLFQRLTYLFRCHRNENPHPCHKRHKQVSGVMPDVDQFCNTYGVRWITTTGLVGRLEIEEKLQSDFGTNTKEYYRNYDSESPFEMPRVHKEYVFCACAKSTTCNFCPIWHELSTNPVYLTTHGILIPTMGGNAKPLCFNYDPKKLVVRVWRTSGKPNFEFNENECRDLCRRYIDGLKSRSLPDVWTLGGTGYFTHPIWTKPCLGRINSPYAAAVIRHILRSLRFSLSSVFGLP